MQRHYIFNIKSRGFTLVEAIVAMSVFAVLIFIVVSISTSFLQDPKQQLISMDNIDQARIISSVFVNELRNATTGSDGSFPIYNPGPSQIIFYSKFGGGSAVNRIRYYVSENTLYKGVVTPTGNPLTYNLSSEVVKPLLVGLANGETPAFYYYDGDYDGSSSPLAQPVNINQVRFIKINLMAPKQTTQQDTSSFLVTAGATIRALKDNLGN